jgi:hypothetical protein
VDILGISAYGYDLGACFFEGFILLCQSSKFGGSNEGEIGGIEEEDGPFLCGFLPCQGDLAEIALTGSKVSSLKSGTFCPIRMAQHCSDMVLPPWRSVK